MSESVTASQRQIGTAVCFSRGYWEAYEFRRMNGALVAAPWPYAKFLTQVDIESWVDNFALEVDSDYHEVVIRDFVLKDRMVYEDAYVRIGETFGLFAVRYLAPSRNWGFALIWNDQ